MGMKFSVTIPAYKSQYLKEAIESVVSQTYSDWELIIVDDCSPENLKSIAEPFLNDKRISYYRNEKNCGAIDVVDNWNNCLNHCTGDYVICMGDDDRLQPCCLEEYQRMIAQYPGLNVYHARTRIIDDAGNSLEIQEEWPSYETCQEMLYGQWKENRKQFIGDFLFSRQWLTDNKGYVKFPLAYCSDWATANLAAKEKGIANGKNIMFEYRSHGNTISRSQNLRLTFTACDQAFRWYEQVFGDMLPDCFLPFFTKHITDLVYLDVTNRPLREMTYWLFYSQKVFISKYEIIKVCLKSIVAKIFLNSK
jgi:glycosyltransferase involved in cell wall biosynthesis